jgi:hypothetical protein
MYRRSPCFAILVLVAVFCFAGSLCSVEAQKGGAASPSQSGAGGAGGGATPYFETEMLAYGAVNELSEAIAQRVCHDVGIPGNSTVIIFDQSSFQNLGTWQSVVASANVLQSAYATLLPQRSVPGRPLNRAAGATGGPFIQGGADLGALITAVAASTTNTASTFTIPDSTVAVSIMHQIQRTNCNLNVIYYPLFGQYADLNSARQEVSTALDQLNATRAAVQTVMNTGGSTGGPISPTSDGRTAVFADLNTQYDALLKMFMSGTQQQNAGGPGNSQNPNSSTQAAGNQTASTSSAGFQSLLEGAAIEQLIGRDDTYILYAVVVAAGGTQRDVKNIVTLFTGDWISYSGGLVANLAVIKAKESSLVIADTLRYRTGFTGIKGFRNPRKSELVENPNSGSNEYSLCNEEKRHHFWSSNRPSALNCPLVAETLNVLSFSPTAATGGTRVVGRVMLPRSPWRDTQISLSCANSPNPAGTPRPNGCESQTIGDVTVGAGSTSAQFTFGTNPVALETPIIVSARYGNETKIERTLVEPPILSSFSIAPNAVVAGGNLDATVTLSGPAPATGALVRIRSSNPAVASAPQQVMDGGSSRKTFRVTTTAAAANAPAAVTFTATLDLSISGTVDATPTPQVQSFTIVVYSQ